MSWHCQNHSLTPARIQIEFVARQGSLSSELDIILSMKMEITVGAIRDYLSDRDAWNKEKRVTISWAIGGD